MHFVDRGQLNLREVVQEDQIWGYWDKGACNHLYWCATSTMEGFGEFIGAKWNSCMQHVAKKHDNHKLGHFVQTVAPAGSPPEAQRGPLMSKLTSPPATQQVSPPISLPSAAQL